jgi:hypothetical protein
MERVLCGFGMVFQPHQPKMNQQYHNVEMVFESCVGHGFFNGAAPTTNPTFCSSNG